MTDTRYCRFCGSVIPVKCDYISLMPRIGECTMDAACPSCFSAVSDCMKELRKTLGNRIPSVRTSIVLEVGDCLTLNPLSSASEISKRTGHSVTDVLKAIEVLERKGLCSAGEDGSAVMADKWRTRL